MANYSLSNGADEGYEHSMASGSALRDSDLEDYASGSDDENRDSDFSGAEYTSGEEEDDFSGAEYSSDESDVPPPEPAYSAAQKLRQQSPSTMKAANAAAAAPPRSRNLPPPVSGGQVFARAPATTHRAQKEIVSYGSARPSNNAPAKYAPAAAADEEFAAAPRSESRALALELRPRATPAAASTPAPAVAAAAATRRAAKPKAKRDPILAASAKPRSDFDMTDEVQRWVERTHWTKVTIPLKESGGLAKLNDVVEVAINSTAARNIFQPTEARDDAMRRTAANADYKHAKIMMIELYDYANPSDVNLGLRFRDYEFFNTVHSVGHGANRSVLLNLPSRGAGVAKTGPVYDCLKEVAQSQLYREWGHVNPRRLRRDIRFPDDSTIRDHPEYAGHAFVKSSSKLATLLQIPEHAHEFGLHGYVPAKHENYYLYPHMAISTAMVLFEKNVAKQMQNIHLEGLTFEWTAAHGEGFKEYTGNIRDRSQPIDAYVTLRIGVTFPGTDDDFVAPAAASQEEIFMNNYQSRRENSGLQPLVEADTASKNSNN